MSMCYLDANATTFMPEIVIKSMIKWTNKGNASAHYEGAEECKSLMNTFKQLILNEHGFIQAPYEEITKEKYDELISNVKPITSGDIHQETDLESDCVGNSCPVK